MRVRVEVVVGWQVRERRGALGLTQEQLGRELALYLPHPWSRQAVSAAEKGDRSFGAAELVALAAVLHTTVGDLLRPPLQESQVELGGAAAVPKEMLFDVIASKLPEDLDFASIQRTLTLLAESAARSQGDVARTLELAQEVDRLITQRVSGPQMTAADATAWRERLDAGDQAQFDHIRNAVRAAGTEQSADLPIPVEEALQQPVATAIVTSSRGVLVGRRNDGKPPWTFIAGEVEPGESPEFAAVREVKEETGLEAQPREEIGRRVHPKTGRTMIYIAAEPVRPGDLEVFVGDSEELAEVRWVSLREADELMAAYGMFEPVHEHLQREIGE